MPGPRFLQLADVAEVLNISANQVYALVRRGDIPANELEKYIERLYSETKDFIDSHPFGEEVEQTEEAHQ